MLESAKNGQTPRPENPLGLQKGEFLKPYDVAGIFLKLSAVGFLPGHPPKKQHMATSRSKAAQPAVVSHTSGVQAECTQLSGFRHVQLN